MVCVEQSDALVRAYQDEDEDDLDLPALEEVRAYQDDDGVPPLVDAVGNIQKCALVIAPTVQGFRFCAVTQDGEEAYWEEFNAPQWRDQADALERIVLFLWNAGLMPNCYAYVENNMSLIHASRLCHILQNHGCIIFHEAPHRPGMLMTRPLMEQYSAAADNYSCARLGARDGCAALNARF
jgi:hypothetical protein